MKIYTVVVKNNLLGQTGVVGAASTREKAVEIQKHYDYMADESKIFEHELDAVAGLVAA